MRKKDRHELIKKIISENAIRNQNELMDYYNNIKSRRLKLRFHVIFVT